MTIFKPLALSLGIKADFNKIYNAIESTKISEAEKDLKNILQVSEKHVLFVKNLQLNSGEIVYIFFNPAQTEENFVLQKNALTYNFKNPNPTNVNKEWFENKVSRCSNVISQLMKKNEIYFISQPLLRIEFVYYDDKVDYSDKLKLTIYGQPKKDKKIKKCTMGFTISKMVVPDIQEVIIETIVEHWINNSKFLFVGATAQWNVEEYKDNDLNFFEDWNKIFFENFNKILMKLRGEENL